MNFKNGFVGLKSSTQLFKWDDEFNICCQFCDSI